MHDVPGTVHRAIRRFTLGSGPLKRRCDRLQFWSRSVAVAILVLAVPVAFAFGIWSRAGLAQTAMRQSAERHEVWATVLAPGAQFPTGSDRAVWTGSDGRTHFVSLGVGLDWSPGRTIPVWVNRNGTVTEAPLTQSDAVAVAVIRSVLAFLGLVALCTAAHSGLVSVLDRRRYRRWDAEWNAIEPRWSGRV